MHRFEFINFDDQVYVSVYITENPNLKLGLTPEGIGWAFSTTYAEFWHPLTWLSLMFDYQLYGANAGGYHFTNVILHIISALLLFRFLSRSTGVIWPGAFAAAFFALHPLRVESVAWVAERKDVLSVFFGMLALCLYGYYTEKPDIKRYLAVFLCFTCSLMSKPMFVTLPVLMILLDYWPLKRFDSRKDNPVLWQAREKTPLLVLSAVFSVVTVYAQRPMFTDEHSLAARLANAPVSVARYLGNTFWPHDLAIFYPFSDSLPVCLVLVSILLIAVITVAAVAERKRFPYLFVGWLWFLIALTPVIGIIRSTTHSMHDCYTYLPSVGLAVGLAWGVPALMPRGGVYKKILSASAVAILLVLSLIAWKQCGYWRDNVVLWTRVLQVTENNYVAHNNLAAVLLDNEKYAEAMEHCNKAVAVKSDFADAYNNRGNIWAAWGLPEAALKDFDEAVRLRPNGAEAYNNRGTVYSGRGMFERAIADFDKAVGIDPGFAVAFNNRGEAYCDMGQYERAAADYSEALRLSPGWAYPWVNRGIVLAKLGQYGRAAEDFNEALRLRGNFPFALVKRGMNYFMLGDRDSGCRDLSRACELGDCEALQTERNRGTCR